MATTRKCGTCREPGHTRATCPNAVPTPASVTDAAPAEAMLKQVTGSDLTSARFLDVKGAWTGALFTGLAECGHRVEEGDMVRPVYAGDNETPALECYAHCGQDDPAGPVAECNGVCLYGSDIGVPGHDDKGPAYPHPECPVHGYGPAPQNGPNDPGEPQAWERPTAANVQMPELPTLPVDAERVAKLEELRNHPASSAPVVGTGIAVVPGDGSDPYTGVFAAEPDETGSVVVPSQVQTAAEVGSAVDKFFGAALASAGSHDVAAMDAFFAPTPEEAEPAKRRQTNQYGYLCKDPVVGDFRYHKNGNVKGITRCTTFVKSASDSTALSAWGKRNVVVGASRRPDLIAQAHGKDVSEDRGFLDDLVESLETAADAKVSADIGTLVHTYTERIDAGEIQFSDVPPAYRGHVHSYRAALERGGFRVVPHLLEGTIFMKHFGGVAGKFDRVLFHEPSQSYVMGDLKTGKNMTYGWDEIEAQEWVYTEGYNAFGTYDWDADTWVPPEYHVRTDVGVVMWLPVQTPTKPYPAAWDVRANGEPKAGVCYLLKTDLQRGARHAELCANVREGRSNKGKPVRWENPPVDWKALFSAVGTVEDAGRLWEQARAAGVAADALGYLVGLAQDRLRSIGSQLS